MGGEVDLFARTWESLDFGVVLDRLSRECRTGMGRSRALVPDFKTTLEEVRPATREGRERERGKLEAAVLVLTHVVGYVRTGDLFRPIARTICALACNDGKLDGMVAGG